MTSGPAWAELHAAAALGRCPVALRVYAILVERSQERPAYFSEPQDVKSATLAYRLDVHPNTITRALDLLIEHGYVVEHGRGLHGVRKLTLVPNRYTDRAA